MEIIKKIQDLVLRFYSDEENKNRKLFIVISRGELNEILNDIDSSSKYYNSIRSLSSGVLDDAYFMGAFLQLDQSSEKSSVYLNLKGDPYVTN